MHGGDIYSTKVKYDFSVNINPFPLPWIFFMHFILSFKFMKNYPDIESHELRDALSKRYNVSSGKIITGNGASEIILSVTKAVNPKKALLVAPCFSGYEHALNSVEAEAIYFPLDEKDGFSFTEEKLIGLKDLLKKQKPDMMFLCNPNNPNGKSYSREIISELAEVCRHAGIFLLIDECFMDLTEKAGTNSFLENLKNHDNLIIVNAITKSYGIPGLRLGYAFCNSESMILKIKKQMPEWNVSTLAQKIGCFILKDKKHILHSIKKFSVERIFLSRELALMGLKVYPSDSNFILFFTGIDIDLKNKLLEKKILIRDCSDYENLEKGFYRIAVKNHKKNKIFLNAIQKIMGENQHENN